ncbi:DUF2339 domain-containing protein [Mangrovibacterium lignilyticum]|uniref:DUF2339 domain-containing protein n=1 Tax=Mangrovibacterium lignilyticum TaxID=2668052 RepID=UPI0013D76293|nr:DUF2339 domain-containing protein [Mangrovibacterium lignilyticum]
MTQNQDLSNQLTEKLNLLIQKQQTISKEIEALRQEINDFKRSTAPRTTATISQSAEEPISNQPIATEASSTGKPKPKVERTSLRVPQFKTNLEKFIGENLINKIGIVITVIGVFIGAKYAIDHELISPVTRIALGYLMGTGLLFFAFKLKSKYLNYSAVLLSGAMTILYFITFIAYSFYNLFPQAIAFPIMVIVTVFTVLSAMKYDKQIIAHLGLVGAYAVPFLLSDSPDQTNILFGYMLIINLGILAISLKRYWKRLYFSAFLVSWGIYFLNFQVSPNPSEEIALFFPFLSGFFAIFYLAFLGYKVHHKEKFELADIILLLLNSFIFFGNGYILLDQNTDYQHLRGSFAIGNALIHAAVCFLIFKQKLVDKNLFYFILALALTFLTIAIPAQFEGNWITVFWTLEAIALFWIGRSRQAGFYELLSYLLMFIAFLSLASDWGKFYTNFFNRLSPISPLVPFLNIYFVSSLLVIIAFGNINLIYSSKRFPPPVLPKNDLLVLMPYLIPFLFLVVTYFTFRLEIAAAWNSYYVHAKALTTADEANSLRYVFRSDVIDFNTISGINYSLLFFVALAYTNLKKLQKSFLAYVCFLLLCVTLISFLTQGLSTIAQLRDSYLQPGLDDYFDRSIFKLLVRYISYGFVAIALIVLHKIIQPEYMRLKINLVFTFMLHLTILWMATSELVNWLEIASVSQSDKLGVSILWGLYSLLLIVLGIRRKNKYLRVGAMFLFGVTLLKLFFYDLTHLNTISKTIVFVSLGVLLLIISFLYNKFTYLISEEES